MLDRMLAKFSPLTLESAAARTVLVSVRGFFFLSVLKVMLPVTVWALSETHEPDLRRILGAAQFPMSTLCSFLPVPKVRLVKMGVAEMVTLPVTIVSESSLEWRTASE